MAAQTVEERLRALESEVAALKKRVGDAPDDARPWWQKISGAFQGDPAFLEAMKLGREYRESLRPKPRAKKKRKKNADS
ncbi:MAG: hypothetical protein WD872_13060 [Pirellulaceae bacterium]